MLLFRWTLLLFLVTTNVSQCTPHPFWLEFQSNEELNEDPPGKLPLPQESEIFFDSFLFADYLNQLKNFITEENSIPEEISSFIHFIEEYEPGLVEENRAFYLSMVEQLRELVKSNSDSDFVDSFCLHFFTSVEMWQSLDQFLLDTFSTETQEKYQLLDLFLQSDSLFSQTKANNSYKGRDKSYNPTNDQILYGNIPYTLFHYNQTQVIRTPSVTKDTANGIEIVEEFYRYLLASKKADKKHLYVNLLTKKYKKGDSLDPERRSKIQELEKNLHFGDATFVITLDKNSPFYFQKDEFVDLKDAAVFIETFHSQMFSSGKFYWSRLPEWEQTCKELLEEIHTQHFNQQSELSVQERLDFIDITYIEIIKKAIDLLEVDTMNVSCLHTIDRGISILSHLYLDHIFQKRSYLTQEEANHFNSLVLIQPIVLHNQPAHLHRINRIVTSSLRMYSN